MKKIIGLMGKMGSGKDTVSTYICDKYGYMTIGYGNITRLIAIEMGLEYNQDNLMYIVNKYIKNFGNDYFSKRMIVEIEESGYDKIVVNGIRHVSDASELIDTFKENVVLLHIDVDKESRYERMYERDRPGDTKTFDYFIFQDTEEAIKFNTIITFGMADIHIDNNSNKKGLFTKIDSIIQDIKFNRLELNRNK